MMNEEIREELNFRRSIDSDSRFDPMTPLASAGVFSLVERNGWQGVASKLTGASVVEPVYDEVALSMAGSCCMAVVRIMNAYGLFLLNEHASRNEAVKALLDPEYDGVEVFPEGQCVRFRKDGREGLYSIRHERIIFDCKYSEVCVNVNCMGIWARKESGQFVIFRSSDGKMFTLPDAERVYEHPERIVYADSDRYATLVSPEGVVDRLGFRRLCISKGGRLKLGNSRMHLLHVCDPSGYILNL